MDGKSISSLVGSAGGLISGLVGSGLSLKAQREANRANMAINQMNNDFNERMMDKQMQFNVDMWNKQNEYNSASAQRKRLEAAGLNPYLMMSGGSAGIAQSSSAVSAASAASPIAMQPASFDTRNIQDALINFFQPLKTAYEINQLGSQNEQQRITNKYWADSLQAEIASKIASTDNTKSKTIYQNLANDLFRSSYSSQLEELMLKPVLTKQQIASLMYANSFDDIRLRYYDQDMQLRLFLTASEIALNNSGKDLNEAKIKTEASTAARNWAEAGLIKSRKQYQDTINLITEDCMDLIKEKYHWDNQLVRQQAFYTYDLRNNAIKHGKYVDKELSRFNLDRRWNNANNLLKSIFGAGTQIGSALIGSGAFKAATSAGYTYSY